MKSVRFDWIAGTVQLDSVQVLLNKLQELSPNHFPRGSWGLMPRGLYNYSHRICYSILDWFSVCWNPDSSVLDKDLYKDQVASCVVDRKKFVDQVQFPEDLGSVCDTWQGSPVWVNMRPVLGIGTNSGVFIQLTGKGCSLLYDFGVMDAFTSWLRLAGFRASRVDVAYDVVSDSDSAYDQLVDVFLHCQDSSASSTLRSRSVLAKNVQVVGISDPFRGFHFNLVFGSHSSSSVMFRCYDKLHERLYNSGIISPDRKKVLESLGYWQRYEFELHSDFAADCFAGEISPYSIWIRAANRLFTPVICDDSNISRCSVSPFWHDLLDEVSQNKYFVSYGAFESLPSREDARFKYLSEQGKSFASQLALISSGKLSGEWVDSSLLKAKSDPVLSGSDPVALVSVVNILCTVLIESHSSDI